MRHPTLDEEMSYVQENAAEDHTILLRSDGTCVFCGTPDVGQCDIPTLHDGPLTYIQISADGCHSVFLRSDGQVVACGFNGSGECDIPPLDGGLSYTQVSFVLVLIRSSPVFLLMTVPSQVRGFGT